MKLVIPDNNDPELVEVVSKLITKSSNHTISEIYGKPTTNKIIGSGRANIFFDNLTRESLVKRVTEFQQLGLEYNYCLNGILPRARILENRNKIIEELEWLESSPINKITTANYELVRLAEKYAPSVDVAISFFAKVDNKKRFEQWARLSNVKSVNTDRITYRNLVLLEELAELGRVTDTEVRVIANLGCMSDCIRTEEHAIMKDMASVDRESLHYAPCTFYCMKYLLENPEEFLKLPIIRPEDLDKYDEISVDSVKLVDRTQTTSWIEKVVGHYLDGSYKGNILELTCNFTRSGVNEMSNKEVAKIDIDKIIESKERVISYRETLPELMRISIDPNYEFLACNNACESCKSGCYDSSAVNYDPDRREIVLAQLAQLEKEHLFK